MADSRRGTAPTASDIADLKDEGRIDRMQSKHKALETRIQQQWQNYAMKLCDPLVKKYWVCRQETGFMVVFKCRDELKEMRECVASHTRDEASFAAFRAERMRVIEEVMGSGGYVRPSHREFKIPSKNK